MNGKYPYQKVWERYQKHERFMQYGVVFIPVIILLAAFLGFFLPEIFISIFAGLLIFFLIVQSLNS